MSRPPLILILVLSLLWASCKKDSVPTTEGPALQDSVTAEIPSGPPGPGIDDGDGFVYFEGFKDSLMCGVCHNPDGDSLFRTSEKILQWTGSAHATSADYNTYDCAGCHTTNGFIERSQKGFPPAYNGYYVNTYINAHPVGCFACHSPHNQGDFSLRNGVKPVLLKSNIIGLSDLSFTFGKGNICLLCHQPRYTTPKLDVTRLSDSVMITSKTWAGHNGSQGEMIAGMGGFPFGGENGSVSVHTVPTLIRSEGCVACHMAQPAEEKIRTGGLHSFRMRYTANGTPKELTAGCLRSGCHDAAGFSFNFRSTQSLVLLKLDTLKTLLEKRNILDGTSSSANIGTIKLTGGTLTLSMEDAGALWNYKYVAEDGSRGIHNASYALSLLNGAIAHLRSK